MVVGYANRTVIENRAEPRRILTLPGAVEIDTSLVDISCQAVLCTLSGPHES